MAEDKKSNPLAQAAGIGIMTLGGILAFIALIGLDFKDNDFIRELVFKLGAFGIGSLWVMAVILFAVGYYIYDSE